MSIVPVLVASLLMTTDSRVAIARSARCVGPNSALVPCVLGRFPPGMAVRTVGFQMSCTFRTAGPAAWVELEVLEDVPSALELEALEGAGRAKPATFLDGVECGEATPVALVGFDGEVQRAELVPVADAGLRKRLTERARNSPQVLSVIRRDEQSRDLRPETEPIEAFRVDGRGPVFVRLKSRSPSGSAEQPGPVVVFEGDVLTTPFALCVTPFNRFRAGGRVFVAVVHGTCDTDDGMGEVFEISGERLVRVLSN